VNKKRENPDDSAVDKKKKKEHSQDGLTVQASVASPSQYCWKCFGKGKKYVKSMQTYDGHCNVCDGKGIRQKSRRSQDLSSKPGQILKLRGYPENHPFRRIFPDGFAPPSSFWGSRHCSQEEDTFGNLQTTLRPRNGELVGSLGCGDWRIYQIADGNKLTVDDFVCAFVAAEEMRKRGYGLQLHPDNAINGDDARRMFGGRHTDKPVMHDSTANSRRFNHADIGTGCGSVLMMIAWAFLGEIVSVGIEAQSVSFECLRRGVEWNLGSDGTHSNDIVQIRQEDLRTWNGDGVAPVGPIAEGVALRPPYRLVTGTPPYFPLGSFVASQNHEQKVRCRIPTRGNASDYIKAASRLLMEEVDCTNDTIKNSDTLENTRKDEGEGVFCMVEAAFEKAEAAVLDAVKKYKMRVQRRVDVVTKVGLTPRFSCWVMTKKSISNIKKKADSDENTTANTSTMISGNSNEKYDFPVEIFTLRNADLTRTEEYTNAMEIMGWVDFEKYKNKSVENTT